ncbi:hypothetical protein SORBI_3003G140450 [Sorghum bicolor]|uniref:Endonuclease/exonuclease/phosphatase domain-containing protein n=1 Tax=Sorghum bicolor TaxID=4558 RepID=A0A1W0VXB5_SORBI|nr:hypothetical protein SORBI_3003G140450 [Sorghum bicolor]
MDKEREAGSSLMLASLLLLMPIKEGALLGLRRQMILLNQDLSANSEVRDFSSKRRKIQDETRMKGGHVANLRWRLGLKYCITVDSVGTGGGLALFWHESVEVSLIEKHQRYIDVHVKENPEAVRTRITFVYGEPRTDQRHIMWELLRRLHGRSSEPWLAIGDFNEAMWGFEHFSACPRPERQLVAFRDALSDCGLSDLGFSGLPYTYNNWHNGDDNVKKAWCTDSSREGLGGVVAALKRVQTALRTIGARIPMAV